MSSSLVTGNVEFFIRKTSPLTGDERLMLASRSTSMEWVSDTSSLESSHFSEVGTKISGTTS